MPLTKLLAVFGLGTLELWAAIPVGLALGLHPVTTAATAALGGVLGAVTIATVGGGVRSWLLRRMGRTERGGAVLRHLKEFEQIVKEFERREAKGTLSGEWRRPWGHLKHFLESEELEGSQEQKKAGSDGRYCCRLRTRETGQVINCRDYNAWYIFAWAACVAEALVGRFDATLRSGRCRSWRSCPQYK